MEVLEKKKTVLFKSEDPVKLMYLIRQALHVEPWYYLANDYVVRIKKEDGIKVGIWCIFKQNSLSLNIQKEIRVIPEEIEFWNLIQEIISIGFPEGITRFLSFSPSPQELKDLEKLCNEKGYKLNPTETYIEIEN